MDEKQVQQAIAVKDAHEQELLALQNVVFVDVGFKYTGGKRSDDIAIRCHVINKQDVAPQDRIPKHIDGIKTDVIQFEEPMLKS